MIQRLTLRAALMLALMAVPPVPALPPPGVQAEVGLLLDYIDGSGCEFYRNGSWHDSKAAQAHIRDKYNYLAERDLIDTTEDFIDKAATKSGLSGQVYLVRCNGGAPVASAQWLRDELVHLRAAP